MVHWDIRMRLDENDVYTNGPLAGPQCNNGRKLRPIPNQKFQSPPWRKLSFLDNTTLSNSLRLRLMGLVTHTRRKMLIIILARSQ